MVSWKAAALLLAVMAVEAARADDKDEGRRLFGSVTPACALCHVLRDAKAEGAVGPSLDELKPDRDRVVKALRNGIGQMPAFRHLSDADVQALARYIEQATK